MLKDISDGEGDMTVRLEIKEENEIGKVSEYFNTFVDKIHQILKKVKSNTNHLSQISMSVKELANTTAINIHEQQTDVEKTKKMINEINNSAYDISNIVMSQSASVTQTNQSVENLKETSIDMSDKSDEMKKFTNEISKMITSTVTSIDEISGSITHNNEGLSHVINNLSVLNDGVSQVSAAIEETLVSINEISSNLGIASNLTADTQNASNEGKNIVEQTIKAMNKIERKVSDIGDIIARLNKSSNEIGDVVGVIDDIAEQTNLLALNAAIEAARAGEAGKGFAVVADEIRKLAEKTTKSTSQIAKTVKAIQQDTNSAVSSMEEGRNEVQNGVLFVDKTGSSLELILSRVKNVSELISVINISSKEQSKAAETISGLVVDMNTSSDESVK